MYRFCVFGREMNRRQTYEQANKIYDKAMKLEQEFGEYFTGKNPGVRGSRVCGVSQTLAQGDLSRAKMPGELQSLSTGLSPGTQVSCQPPVSQVLAQATPRRLLCLLFSCSVRLHVPLSRSFLAFLPDFFFALHALVLNKCLLMLS